MKPNCLYIPFSLCAIFINLVFTIFSLVRVTACVFFIKLRLLKHKKDTSYCIHQLFFVILHSISINNKDYA